jgi:exodeoxyribonuclease-3
MSISICSFNVNSIRARIELIQRWLTEKRSIDILCFQEIKCTSDQFPVETFEALGYHCAINGEKRFNGVAICSKYPITSVKTTFGIEVLDRQKRLIEAKIGDSVILNCYIPRGDLEGEERHSYKMAFYDALTDYTRHLLSEHEKVILLGDFNVALTDRDVYDVSHFEGEVGFLPSEKEKLLALMGVGLEDCLRKEYPDKHIFTWWDYRTAGIWRNEGMRIDYIFASQPLCQYLESIEVDLWTRKRRTPTPSDHAPLIANFKVF